MNWKLPTAIILFLIAGWFYQQHEHVNFNYAGSYWERLDNNMGKPWFKNNSHPEWQEQAILQFLPFTWDGYHFFSWAMKYCYFMIFAIYLYSEEPYWRLIIGVGLLIAIIDFALTQLTYGWFFL